MYMYMYTGIQPLGADRYENYKDLQGNVDVHVHACTCILLFPLTCECFNAGRRCLSVSLNGWRLGSYLRFQDLDDTLTVLQLHESGDKFMHMQV